MFLVPGTLGGSNPRYKQFFWFNFCDSNCGLCSVGGGEGGGGGEGVGTFIIYIDDYRI